MPLDVAANISQESINWILRLIIYSLIAIVIGFFADYYKQELENGCKKDKDIAEAQMATIYSLVKLAESRDDDTGAHVERVGEYCKLLANKLRNLNEMALAILMEYQD